VNPYGIHTGAARVQRSSDVIFHLIQIEALRYDRTATKDTHVLGVSYVLVSSGVS
jgi:hypothetical protein